MSGDFSRQHARITRAERQGAELGAAIQAWVAGEPMSGKAVIAHDRLSWELRLISSTVPPIEEWAGAFADAVHNLRAALDNFIRAIADQAGVTDPKALRQLAFPICASTDDWKNGKRKIASLPESYRQAIEAIQPFQRDGTNGTPSQDALRLLRDLDNQDKHQVQVTPAINPRLLEHAFSVEFETEEGAAASVPPDVKAFLPAFEDGAVLLHWDTKGPIAKVRGSLAFGAQAQVRDPEGGWIDLTGSLAGLCYYTRVVLQYVADRGARP